MKSHKRSGIGGLRYAASLSECNSAEEALTEAALDLYTNANAGINEAEKHRRRIYQLDVCSENDVLITWEAVTAQYRLVSLTIKISQHLLYRNYLNPMHV